MLQLLDLNKNKIAGLTEYKDLCIESVLKTGDKTLSFLYSNKSKYYDEIVEESYIRTKTNEYVVKEKNLQSNYTTFICKLNVEDIEGKEWDRFESVEQTIINALNLGIVGTSWTIGKTECDIKKKRTIRVTNCSSWDIIQQIKKTYRVEIEFDTINKKINLYEHIGTDKGTYFVDSLNLKSLNVQGNSYDYVTRIIPVGKDGITIEDINNGKKYVENYQYTNKIKTLIWKDERYTIKENLKNDAIAKLDEISKPYRAYSLELINLAKLNDKYKDVLDYSLGDTITILSKENNIKEKQRIVKIKEYPQDHTRDTVEIANTILRFEDIQQENQETTDTLNNVTLDNGTLDGEAFEDGGISSKKIENFKANVIEAAEIHVIKGDIQDLNVAVLKAGQAIITKVDTTQLNALESKLQHALIGKADVNELNVAVERVGILEGKTLSVENQLAGNLTAKNFKTNSITAGSGIIAEGAIGSAQISSLSVNKLEAGDIITSKHKIVSEDGTIEIVGNQILINRNNVNRVILGEYRKQDNTTDYGLLIRAKDGKTIMLDSEGVHNAGITDGAINNNKVADNANISGNKLDINSVIREVNNKGTETIKGTKVTVGDRTLDVELSTQKNTITEHRKELSNQKATINALDNAIKLKVDNQTFTQSTSTINKNINNLNNDLVSKINSSLSTAKSYSDSKKQEAINSSNSHADSVATNKANESLNNAKAYTNAQVTTVNSNLSKATSEINILKNQISTKVGQSDIDKSVQEIKFNDVNMLFNSANFKDISHWSITNGSENLFVQNNYLVAKFNNYANWGCYVTNDSLRNIPLDTSKKYTVVCKLKASRNQAVNFQIIDGDSSNFVSGSYFELTTNWNIFKYTFIPSKKGNERQFRFITSNLGYEFDLYIEFVKMVEGATSSYVWTSNPLEVNQTIVDNIKVVTDKISDVSTKLTQTKDSLQASVNSLNSTTQTITTNLTKTNNDLSNKINIAKNDAISSANSHADSVATTKANIAQSTAIAHADSKANDAKNQAINSANTYTNAQITTVNTRVSNAESNINILKNQISTKVSQSDIDRSINSIEFGGRNLILNSGYCKDLKYWGKNVGGGATSKDIFLDNGKDGEYHGPNLTNISFPSGWCILTNTSLKSKKFKFEVNEKYTIKGVIWTNNKGNVEFQIADDNSLNCVIDSIITINGWGYTPFNITFTPKIQGNENSIRFCINKEGQSIFIPYIKLVKGTINGDWTPAPEDIEQEIKDNITTVTTKISNVESNLIQKTNNINATVSSVQSMLNTKADGSVVSSMQSQLASINIGLDGIKNEVAKKTDKGSIISAINQSAEEIKIDASKIKINGLTTFASKTGLKAIEIEGNSINFYDWEGSERKEYVGEIFSTRTNGDARKPGIAIGHKKNSTFDIVYQDGNNNTSFMTFDKNNILGNKVPITINEDIALNASLLYLSTSKINDIYESQEGYFCIEAKHGVQITDVDTKNITALLGSDRTSFAKWNQNYYYAEFFPGGCDLGTGSGKSYANFFSGGFALRSGNGEAYLWADAGSSDIWTKRGVNLRIQGSLSVNGSKNRIVETMYGDLKLNAIESTECWFTDMLIEQSRTDSNGDCIIWFDNKFLQTVNTRCKYKIDVTPIGEFASNGKLTYVRVVEKTEKYFKVRGTPNTLFDWTITAKQKGYERDRLEVLKAS